MEKIDRVLLISLGNDNGAGKIVWPFFQGASDLMMFLDPLGHIVRINPAGSAFSGFTEEEIIRLFFYCWKHN